MTSTRRLNITHKIHYRTIGGVDKVIDCHVVKDTYHLKVLNKDKDKIYKDAVKANSGDDVLEILSFSEY